jgi:hypothetical protein
MHRGVGRSGAGRKASPPAAEWGAGCSRMFGYYGSLMIRQRLARASRNAAISSPLRTSRTSPTSTGWFQVLPSIALNRASSEN